MSDNGFNAELEQPRWGILGLPRINLILIIIIPVPVHYTVHAHWKKTWAAHTTHTAKQRTIVPVNANRDACEPAMVKLVSRGVVEAR